MLTVPLFGPIIRKLGFDPIWFGVLFAVNMQMSFLTPPFGMSLFYLKSVAPPECLHGGRLEVGRPVSGPAVRRPGPVHVLPGHHPHSAQVFLQGLVAVRVSFVVIGDAGGGFEPAAGNP